MEYNLRSDMIKDEDDNEITVYGIDVKCDDIIVKSYVDIYFEKQEAEKFVIFCRENNLPIELIDICIQNLFN